MMAQIRIGLLCEGVKLPNVAAPLGFSDIWGAFLFGSTLMTCVPFQKVPTPVSHKYTDWYLKYSRGSQILCNNPSVEERWTRERRLEHTRSLLLDAAEQVFAENGFTAASLDGIAHAAGYTKGAIYKHFSAKEELFLAVSDRYWRRYFDNFTEVFSTSTQVGDQERDEVAQRWRQLSRDRGARHAALGQEFTLYLLRNPGARERVAQHRLQVAESLAKYIVQGVERLGGALLMPALAFAQLLIATTDAVVVASELDGVDLYRPAVDMYVSAIKLP